jgi:hypothetical protein
MVWPFVFGTRGERAAGTSFGRELIFVNNVDKFHSKQATALLSERARR